MRSTSFARARTEGTFPGLPHGGGRAPRDRDAPTGGLSIRKFFNTSGMVYRDNNIKEQLDAGMSDSDAYNLLATTGMLVKRPLVVAGNTILLGFKEPAWEEALL